MHSTSVCSPDKAHLLPCMVAFPTQQSTSEYTMQDRRQMHSTSASCVDTFNLVPPPSPSPSSSQVRVSDLPIGTVTAVTTAEGLQNAFAASARDVEIRSHLDMRSLARLSNPDIHPAIAEHNNGVSAKLAMLYARPPMRSMRVRLGPRAASNTMHGLRLSWTRVKYSVIVNQDVHRLFPVILACTKPS